MVAITFSSDSPAFTSLMMVSFVNASVAFVSGELLAGGAAFGSVVFVSGEVFASVFVAGASGGSIERFGSVLGGAVVSLLVAGLIVVTDEASAEGALIGSIELLSLGVLREA